MGVPALRYHRVTLPAFPGLELPAAFDSDTQRLWFPVATVCEALELEVRPQRARVQRDYAEHVDKFRLPTDGGPQTLLCVEYEALALWLATTQGSKSNARFRERLRFFRAQVMAAASDILMGRLQPVPLEERRRAARGSIAQALQLETRIEQLERAVFVGEPAEDDARISHCPYCGGAIRVTVGTLQVTPAQ